MMHLETQDISVDTQGQVSDFLAHAARASKRALLLDYDGTLAPFSPDRNRALPYPQVPALLERIRECANTRVAVISGRRAPEVATLLGLKHIEVWGCHGLSRLHADGRYELPELEDELVGRICEANELLRQEGLFDLLEFKPAATAIHWRGLEATANQIARRVQKVWAMLPDHSGLQLVKFDGGMEIRVASRDKGDAVRTILSEMGSGAAVAYLGDDLTDEDAFAALHGCGLGVLVRHEYRPTLANVWIQPPEALVAFLADWAVSCGGAS